MDSWCRVCSRNDDFRRFPLYAVAEVSQEVIANMLTNVTDTQVSSEDGLPQQICPDCLITLSLAYSFRRLCRRNDAKFRESYEGRAPSQSADPRRSHSHAHDDNSYEPIPAIKEEVEIYDYDCSVPPHEDQWVIQNPRTIREGAMAIVHNTSQYYDEADGGGGGGPDPSALMPLTTLGESHDQLDLGEGSGMAQKGEKWKKIPPTPERFSKRIRRHSDEYGDIEYVADGSKEVEVLKTSRGKDLLALDGYVFYKNSQRGSRCYWECKGRTRKLEGQVIVPKCPARVTTDFFDNKHELLSYKGKHTHLPDPSLIQEIKQRNLLKECAASDSSKPSEIMRQVHETTALPFDHPGLSKNAQRKIIKRARTDETGSEQVHVPLEAIEVPFDYIQTLDGAQFYQGDVKAENQTAFIFASQADIRTLAKATFWLTASTYSAKTGLQRQLFTIHSSLGPYHQQACPVIYVLLSASCEALYRQVFVKLKQIAQDLETKMNPQLILVDFEKPLVSALEVEFPHTRLSVCFFHLSHHLFRAVEKHGLSMSFEKNYWLLQNYKRMKALAFLPPEHIPDAFYVLKSNAPLELHRFLDDFAENYIFGKVMLVAIDGTPVRSRPLFAPSFWSLHTNIMQGIPNIYQHTKEWHYRMARLLTAHSFEPFRIFATFQQQHQETQLKVVAIVAGMGPSRKTEEDQRSDSIRHIAANFTSYPTLQFLDAVADNLGSDAR